MINIPYIKSERFHGAISTLLIASQLTMLTLPMSAGAQSAPEPKPADFVEKSTVYFFTPTEADLKRILDHAAEISGTDTDGNYISIEMDARTPPRELIFNMPAVPAGSSRYWYKITDLDIKTKKLKVLYFGYLASEPNSGQYKEDIVSIRTKLIDRNTLLTNEHSVAHTGGWITLGVGIAGAALLAATAVVEIVSLGTASPAVLPAASLATGSLLSVVPAEMALTTAAPLAIDVVTSAVAANGAADAALEVTSVAGSESMNSLAAVASRATVPGPSLLGAVGTAANDAVAAGTAVASESAPAAKAGGRLAKLIIGGKALGGVMGPAGLVTGPVLLATAGGHWNSGDLTWKTQILDVVRKMMKTMPERNAASVVVELDLNNSTSLAQVTSHIIPAEFPKFKVAQNGFQLASNSPVNIYDSDSRRAVDGYINNGQPTIASGVGEAARWTAQLTNFRDLESIRILAPTSGSLTGAWLLVSDRDLRTMTLSQAKSAAFYKTQLQIGAGQNAVYGSASAPIVTGSKKAGFVTIIGDVGTGDLHIDEVLFTDKKNSCQVPTGWIC